MKEKGVVSLHMQKPTDSHFDCKTPSFLDAYHTTKFNSSPLKIDWAILGPKQESIKVFQSHAFFRVELLV